MLERGMAERHADRRAPVDRLALAQQLGDVIVQGLGLQQQLIKAIFGRLALGCSVVTGFHAGKAVLFWIQELMILFGGRSLGFNFVEGSPVQRRFFHCAFEFEFIFEIKLKGSNYFVWRSRV